MSNGLISFFINDFKGQLKTVDLDDFYPYFCQ